MADIASLGIRVTTTGAKEAAADLDKLSKAGANTANVAKSTAENLGKAGVTWRQFVAERMSDYMRMEGGHAGAMKRMGAEWKTYKATVSGVGNIAAPLQQIAPAVAGAAKAMDKAGLSTKQLAFATRGVPAQFTDIFTSLQGGQRPLQVLLQQGGQLKDMFGGIGPAARAMGGYVLGLVNPFTLAAAAALALGVAWNKAESEGTEFNKAIILTGNYAGTTAEQLSEMAQQIDRTTSATAGKASEVLAQVASTGKFTADQIGLVSTAAINMQDATGKAIEDTVKEFASLAGDPVAAILKLNEAQHFLTEETLAQIQTLKDQGREADATAVAIRAYADVINERTPKITENLSTIGAIWRDIRNASREAGDEMVQAFRNSDSAAQQSISNISALMTNAGPLFALLGKGAEVGFRAYAGQTAAQAKKLPQMPGVLDGSSGGGIVDNKTQDAQRRFREEGLRYLSSSAKMEKDIKDMRALATAAGIKDVAVLNAREAAIRKSYADKAPKPKKGRKPAAEPIDPAISIISRIKQQIATNTEQLASEEKLTASDRMRISIQNELENSGKKITASRRADIEAQLLQLDASGKALAALEAELKIKEEGKRLTESLLTPTEELNKLRADARALLDAGAISQATYNRSIEAYADPGQQMLDDLRFELELLKMTNAERATAIQLRGMDAEQVAKYGEAIRQANVDLERMAESQALIDDFKASLSDAFVDFASGAKSAKEAFGDFADYLFKRALQFVADKAIQAMFDAFSNKGATGGGAAAGGGWAGVFSSLIGAFSGGGRAIGGPVSAGGMYEVGERNKPELLQMHGKQWLIPGNNGQVTPMAAGAGGSTSIQQTFVIQGRLDARTEAQLQHKNGMETQRAMSRNR